MPRLTTAYFAGAAFALSAALGVAAHAQPPAPPAPMAHGDHQEKRMIVIRHGDEGAAQADHLRAILQLKPGQDAALTAYLAALKPMPHKMDGSRTESVKDDGHGHVEMRIEEHAPPKATPDRLARMEAQMAEHEAAMHKQIDATRKFYDQLEPAQKKAFDELPLMMGGHMGGHMGGMGPMMPMKTMMMHPPMPPMPAMPPVPPTPPRS